jgi:hypothetical protein
MSVKIYLKTNFLPHSVHCASITEINNLIPCREIRAVHCHSCIELTNTLCGKKAEFFNINSALILGFKFQILPRAKGFLNL